MFELWVVVKKIMNIKKVTNLRVQPTALLFMEAGWNIWENIKTTRLYIYDSSKDGM